LCPLADADEGLDVTALRSLHTPTVLRVALHSFASGKHIEMRSIAAFHDLERFTVESTRPVLWQTDGDFAGEETRFEFENVPGALSVLV
jgi:diacylglycerol kinase family enzyme